MLSAVTMALPADAAIFAAAVADWRVTQPDHSKIKKHGASVPVLELAENSDILREIAMRETERPKLVIGFAAETDDVVASATAKRIRKGCDWLLANDVSDGTGIMGGNENMVTFITGDGAEAWPRMSKQAVAEALAKRIVAALA